MERRRGTAGFIRLKLIDRVKGSLVSVISSSHETDTTDHDDYDDTKIMYIGFITFIHSFVIIMC